MSLGELLARIILLNSNLPLGTAREGRDHLGGVVCFFVSIFIFFLFFDVKFCDFKKSLQLQSVQAIHRKAAAENYHFQFICLALWFRRRHGREENAER